MPKVHLVVKNRLTQYMGPASAYSAVLKSVERDVGRLVARHPDLFTFADPNLGFVNVRDFQTTGVAAFAMGCPFEIMRDGKLSIMGRRVRVKRENINLCREAVNELVDKL